MKHRIHNTMCLIWKWQLSILVCITDLKSGLQDKGILKKRTMVWLFITLIYRIYRNTNIKSYSSSCNLIKHWGGGWHERTNSDVNSEQETKMEGVQHVYYKKDNIDAALVCEDRLREHTWTINGKFHPPLHQRVGGMKVRVLRQFQNKKSKWKPFNMFPMEGMKYSLWGQHCCSSGLCKQIEGAHVNHQWKIWRSWCSPGLWNQNLRAHVNHQLKDNLNVTLV